MQFESNGNLTFREQTKWGVGTWGVTNGLLTTSVTNSNGQNPEPVETVQIVKMDGHQMVFRPLDETNLSVFIKEVSLVTDSAIDTYLANKPLNSNEALNKAPRVLAVQTTHFPGQGGNAMWRELKDTNLVMALGRDASLDIVLQAAYRFKRSRMVLPKDLPAIDYDFMATLPNCPRKASQDEVEQTTGFHSHAALVNTDALVLKLKNAGAPGLKIATRKQDGFRQWWGDAIYTATTLPVSDLADVIESTVFKRPVIDQTGLTDNYNIDIKWEANNEASLKAVLLDQLGIEVVATNMPVEMLVVEKAK